MSLESFLIRGDKRVSNKAVVPVDDLASQLNPIDQQKKRMGKEDKAVEFEPRISIQESLVCLQKLRQYELQQKEPDYESIRALDRAERTMQASSNVEALVCSDYTMWPTDIDKHLAQRRPRDLSKVERGNVTVFV